MSECLSDTFISDVQSISKGKKTAAGVRYGSAEASRHPKTGHASCHSLLSSFLPLHPARARHLSLGSQDISLIHKSASTFIHFTIASNDSPRQLVLFQILGSTIATGTLSVAFGLAGPTTIATGAQGDGAPGAGQGRGGTEVRVVVHVEVWYYPE